MAHEVVGYVCTHDTDAPSIQVQLMVGILHAWAQDHGVTFAATYHDYVGVPGSSQPGWVALWTHCGTGQVKQIVILAPRWVRWPRDRYRRLERRGIRVVSVWNETARLTE